MKKIKKEGRGGGTYCIHPAYNFRPLTLSLIPFREIFVSSITDFNKSLPEDVIINI